MLKTWIYRVLCDFRDKNREILRNNEGVGVVEVILILVVLIGLVVIFRDQLTSVINSIFARITTDAAAV